MWSIGKDLYSLWIDLDIELVVATGNDRARVHAPAFVRILPTKPIPRLEPSERFCHAENVATVLASVILCLGVKCLSFQARNIKPGTLQ